MNCKCLITGLNSLAIRSLNFRRRRLTRGVSRWLSWSDFFSRQMQMLQLSTHHAGTRLHPFDLCGAYTQFGEGDVRLFLGFGADEFRTGMESAFRSVGLGASR